MKTDYELVLCERLPSAETSFQAGCSNGNRDAPSTDSFLSCSTTVGPAEMGNSVNMCLLNTSSFLHFIAAVIFIHIYTLFIHAKLLCCKSLKCFAVILTISPLWMRDEPNQRCTVHEEEDRLLGCIFLQFQTSSTRTLLYAFTDMHPLTWLRLGTNTHQRIILNTDTGV